MVPHFDLPFRFVAGHAAVVDQDTTEDIINCVEAVVLTRIGERIDLPTFGIPDPTFNVQPFPVQEIVNAIIEAEPRANIVMAQQPDLFDALIDRVIIQVSRGEVA